MKTTRQLLKILSVFLLTATAAFFLMDHFGKNLQKNEELLSDNTLDSAAPISLDIELVAIGDSLTEGVGDSTKRGGYVPLTAEELKRNPAVHSVHTRNFGKSGNTTKQITDRISGQEEIQAALKKASVITVSAGGNDLIHKIRKSGFKADQKFAEKSLEDYQNSLRQMINEIRSFNEDAPLFLFGIYNPYEKELKEVVYLQMLVSDWNRVAEEETIEESNSFFIPVNQLFISDEVTVAGEDAPGASTSDETANPYLFEGDYFHPNEKGYQLMADTLSKEILKVLNNEK